MKNKYLFISVISFFLLVIFGCNSDEINFDNVTIESQVTLLLGKEPYIVIENLPVNKKFKIDVFLYSSGTLWNSFATFKSNNDGVIDILTNKPLKGSCYNQVDNSGLFWSMKMVTSDLHYTSFLKRIDSLKDEHLYIDIVFEDSIILSKEIVRISVDESVSIDTISIDGTDVFLYKGLQGKDKPILITLGGSEGGSFWGNLISGALSSRGFYSLSIPYVNIPNQPTTFENIDLKLFESAISFLRKHYPSQKIIPIGVSRGGELSLLISSMFGLDGAIAYCPSNVVWSGYSKYKRIQDFPAWVIEEKEIPYISAKMPPFGKFSSDHYMYTMKYSKNLPFIEVEKILGPILLITGQDDRVWPANYMS